MKFDLHLPADFDEACWDSKGYFPNASVRVGDRTYRVTFYDPVRLAQDAADETRDGGIFFEPNLVVVGQISRSSLGEAVEWLMKTGQLDQMVAA